MILTGTWNRPGTWLKSRKDYNPGKYLKKLKAKRRFRQLGKAPIEFDRAIYPKNVQWMHDFDYLKKLPLKEQEWMAKFIREYINGNVKKGDRKALHRTKELRRDCYQRKNAQNRDMMSILNANGRMDRIQEADVESIADNDVPTQVIKASFNKLNSKQRKNAKRRS